MLFLCYPKCSTCQKAKAFLDANNIPYELRDIKLDNPSEEELRRWHALSGLPLKKFFQHEKVDFAVGKRCDQCRAGPGKKRCFHRRYLHDSLCGTGIGCLSKLTGYVKSSLI